MSGRGGEAGQDGMPAPELALARIAALLRDEDSVISPLVVDPTESPHLGLLCAAGPRVAGSPDEYALAIEAVREGYLLHYGHPRLLAGHDGDLALLAGDYLYALGIERLSRLGDSEALTELADLISLVAEAATESRPELEAPLWLAGTVAVGCGADQRHAAAKAAARELRPDAAALLWKAASASATACGLGDAIDRAAEAIDFRLPNLADG